MKLREKTLILIGITIVCSIAVMYIATTVTLIGGFENLEKENTIKNVELASSALSHELSDLNDLLYDWSVWDDSYKFVQDNNSGYIESNLVDSTFSNLKLNFIIYVDNSGRIVYSKGYNLINNTKAPLPQGLTNYLTKDSILLKNNGTNGVSGIILLPEGPALISSHPILTTDEKGPSRGALIFGRMLDESEIQNIAIKTQQNITISNLNGSITPDFQNALRSINESNPYYVNPLNQSYIAGYEVINDIYGKPAFILRINDDRSFFNEYKGSLTFFLFSLVLVGLVLAITTLIYVDRSILSRLSRLDKNIVNIGKKGNISSRVFMDGDDELSSLANSINTMLS
ncbi:MAG TPA: CHASE4 domain-containing protein, partial [Methanobacterium sp.]|nr:CHASE4 domain-containing protein [Methanobacterium sp.]